jgi:gamma-glutamyltranspeptidase/glutathione hydrolase
MQHPLTPRQGLAALIAFGIVDALRETGVVDLEALEEGSTEWYHVLMWVRVQLSGAALTISEAMRLGYADAQYWIADPNVVDVPVKDLLSKVLPLRLRSRSAADRQEYLQKRAKLFDTKKANAQYLNGNPLPSSDTVYLTTADSEGNAVSSGSDLYLRG